jgi:hypothetical protein
MARSHSLDATSNHQVEPLSGQNETEIAKDEPSVFNEQTNYVPVRTIITVNNVFSESAT